MTSGSRRNLLFGVVTSLFVVACIELASYLALAFAEGRPAPLAGLNARRDELASEGAPTQLYREVRLGVTQRAEPVHPYLGFVQAPTGGLGTQSLGFGESASLLQRRSPERLLVGITGGSFARDFADAAAEVLVPRLARSPALAGREIVILPLCLGGYKEPQQLMALNYLFALGGELDVLLNIDGFNEVALHEAENQRRGVFPAFPRNWYMRTRALPDPVVLPIVGRIAYLETERRRWARKLRQPPLRWSATANAVWLVRDRLFGSGLAEAQQLMLDHSPERFDYTWTGPRVGFDSEAALYAELVAIWSRSSEQLQHLSAANGVRYLQFLQPNQYVAGSKPMRAAEAKQALSDDSPYRRGVAAGYPGLVRECAQLAARGVPCHDLTQLFAAVEEPLYRDDCCHLEIAGYNRVGERVAGEVLAALGSAAAPSAH